MPCLLHTAAPARGSALLLISLLALLALPGCGLLPAAPANNAQAGSEEGASATSDTQAAFSLEVRAPRTSPTTWRATWNCSAFNPCQG